jgi:hypothetical protein
MNKALQSGKYFYYDMVLVSGCAITPVVYTIPCSWL